MSCGIRDVPFCRTPAGERDRGWATDVSSRRPLVEVNSHILEAARDSLGDIPVEEWEFFCECGQPDCQVHVKLTLAAYTALHDAGLAALAPGHQLDPRTQARGIREEARALRAEASQIRRSGRERRNRKD